jgi:GNAT superfamily N-acetyltransferase
MSYHVRAADPAAAGPSLCELWSRNLATARSDPHRRLDWFYLENPAGRGVAQLLESDGEATGPVGCMGIGIRTYECNGRTISVALFGDFAVDRSHRSLGPALMLQRAARRHAQEHFAMALGFPNAKALPSFLRLGFRELGQMIRYAVPLRHRTYVRRRLPEPAASLAAVGLDALAVVRAAPGFLVSLARFHLENLAEPDARFDALWQCARSSSPCVAERTSSFLRWRFLDKPGLTSCRFWALTRRDTGTLAAYAVVETEGLNAHIRDLFGASPEDIAALLDRLLPTLRSHGYVAASFGFFGAPWLVKLLTQRRFAVRERWTVIIDWGKNAPASPERLLDHTAWFVTQADEDA